MNLIARIFILLVVCSLTMAGQPPLLLYATTSAQGVGDNVLSGSLRGGTMIYINGLGFPQDSTMITVFLGPYQCIIPAEGVNTNFVTCETTDSHSDTNVENLDIKVIINGQSSYTLEGYKFSYLTSKTPIITDLFPSAGAAQDEVYFTGNHIVSDFGDGQRDVGDFVGLHIGEELCGLFDIHQQFQPTHIECMQAREQEAGNYNINEHTSIGIASKDYRLRKTSLISGEHYEYTVMPTISAITPNQGSSTGNDIVITGTGFSRDLTKNSIQIDGVDCQVTAATLNQVSCTLPAKAAGDSAKLSTNSGSQQNGYLAGSGFKYERYSVQGLSSTNFKSALDAGSTFTLLESGFRSEMKTSNFYGSNYGQVFKGYFLAPVSGNYIFRGSADDDFALYVSTEYGTTNSLSSTPLIYGSTNRNTFNNLYIENRATAMGDNSPVYFEEGKYYYMEAYHINGPGNGFFYIQVEVPNTDDSKLYHSHEVNNIKITFTNDPQIMEFSLVGYNATVGGNFKLSIVRQNQTTLQYITQQVLVPTSATPTQFVNALKTFDIYSPYTLTGLSVTSYDEYGNETDIEEDIFMTVWEVEIYELRSTQHLNEQLLFNQWDVEMNSYNNSDVQFVQERVHEHCPLISGTFTMEIGGQPITIWNNPSQSFTSSLPFNINSWSLQSALRRISGFQSVEVYQDGDYWYGQSRWIISYWKANLDIPDIIVSASGLSGGKAGTSPIVTFQETRKYSSNLLFRPINERFMFMATDKPNAIITVNGIPSVCTDDCSYIFASHTFQVTSQTISGNIVTIAMTNPQNFPIPTSFIRAKVGNQPCTFVSGTLTNFQCQLPDNADGSPILQTGQYDVNLLLFEFGYIDIRAGTPKIVQSLQLDTISPSSSGTNGGYQITIDGHGFPKSIDSLHSISMCGVRPSIISMSNTQMKLIAPACSAGIEPITFTYNGFSDSIDFQYTNGGSPVADIFSIYPTSRSPVLKGVMTITGSGFGTDMSQISVHLQNGTGKVYQMRVLELADDEIKAGIPGGLPGNFDVRVTIEGQGDIQPSDPLADDFVYELVIESISPATGPYYGGTLLTITGRNFSPNDLENLVFVGDQLNWFCELESFSQTQITCRVPEAHPDWSSLTQNVVVTGKLIQDSICPSNNCGFTYQSNTTSPSLDELSTNSTISGTGSLTLTGNLFDMTGDPNDAQVVFQNRLTSEISIVTPTISSSNSLTINVPSLQAGIYSVRVRFGDQGQTNQQVIQFNSSLSTTSYTGSVEGGCINVIGHGLPTQWPAKLFTIEIKSEDDGISHQIQVISSNANVLQLKINAGTADKSYNIKITDPNQNILLATFVQNMASTPKSVLISPSSAIAAGTNQNIQIEELSLINQVPSKIYLFHTLSPDTLIQIPSFTTNSANIEFTSTLSAGSYGFKIFYIGYGWSQCHDILRVTPPSSYSVSSTVSTSYFGGRITVNGQHINQNAVLKVGGFQGKLISVSASSAVFQIPKLVTPTTISAYPELNVVEKISHSSVISDDSTDGNPSMALDGKHGTAYRSTNIGDCYIGMDIGSQKLVKIDRIRYFPYNQWIVAADYLQGAIFEASRDGITYTQIGEVDTTVHAGWNSFRPSTTSTYRYIRMRHTQASQCRLSQFEVYGVLHNNLNVASISSFTTSGVFYDGHNSYTFSNKIIYTSSNTPIIQSITPETGTIYGGDVLTLTGQYLTSTTSLSILIDDIPCSINTATSSSITCTTGARLSLPQNGNSFLVNIDGKRAGLSGNKFQYVMRWSDIRTWGTDLPPVEGDLVYVPKGMALYVDQSTPLLEGIVVQDGALIFADQADMEIHTKFITLNRGQFRAGTEAKPYQHKLTFIMYGSYFGKQQPMFGNKGIGCKECKFSMHGAVRSRTWTTIAQTINPTDTTLVLSESVDWAIGEQIVVASTDFDHNHAERKIIKSISGLTITVDSPFVYRHFSGTEDYGNGDTLKINAEVGLLTRNIKMRGSENSETIDGQYGSHLMVAGSAEQGMIAHVAYSEFMHCGQPRIVGRYCIHFHMNGDVADSYVKGNAVHDSFARVLTLHGVHYLHVSHNVGYRVKGHNFFIEDGIQTQNVIEYNLAISSLESWNMMQTDISVASFWVTNPTNHLRFNRAAGGDFYGFWYEIKQHPDGPSATSDVCPEGNPLGESHDNIAHSYKRFGLRIFQLYSRKFPCRKMRDNSLADPWSVNPSIESKFYNYIVYKNGESGVLAEQVGNMVFENITSAENGIAGFQFWRTNYTKELVITRNCVVVGQTINIPENSTSTGILGPRTSGVKFSNVHFYNFGVNTTIMTTCSQCNLDFRYVNVANQYEVEGIIFGNITGNYLNMLGLNRDIIYDLDGSFSSAFDGNTRSSAAIVRRFPHLEMDAPACLPPTHPGLWDDALACDESVQVRAVMFTNFLPQAMFKGAPMKIQLLEDIDEETNQTLNEYTEILSYFGMKEPKIHKKFSYSIPFIAGRIYNIWWLTGIDFSHVSLDLSKFFEDSDPAIIFKFNYTEPRELFDIGHLINYEFFGDPIQETEGVPLDATNCQFGDHTHDNDTRIMTLCATSRGKLQEQQYMDVNGIKCRYFCPDDDDYISEDFIRQWSNVTQWPGQRLPADGENVTIPGQWVILMDITPAEMNFWHIDGEVIIPQTNPEVHIRCYGMWIRGGSLKAGNQTHPYTGKLTIQMLGMKQDRGYVFNPMVAGNKIIGISGKLQLYGVAPTTTWTMLHEFLYPGDTSMEVGSTAGWQVGDQLVIGPSFNNSYEHERVTITSISGNVVNFTPALIYKHYGSSSITISNSIGTLDTRSAIGHVTRNIKIISGDDEGWGYRIEVFSENDNGILRIGSVVASAVQFDNGGQYDTENTVIKMTNLYGDGNNSNLIQDSSFKDCKTYCYLAQNITSPTEITNNVFYKAILYHVNALNIPDFTFHHNLMIGVFNRSTINVPIHKQPIFCFSMYNPMEINGAVSIRHNLCQGSDLHGFALPHIPCQGISSPPYSNNTAGSAQIGFIFNKISGYSCLAVTEVKAYACEIGQICSVPGPTQLVVANSLVADCGRGLTLRFGGAGDNKTAYLRNSYVSAISRPDCTDCYGDGVINCTGRHAVRMLSVTVNGQKMPGGGPGFDVICKQEVFDAKAFVQNVIFENYNQAYAELPQCERNNIFVPHELAADLTGSHHLHGTTCNNCSLDSIAYFLPPEKKDLGWSGGCGKIFCTGMNNYLIHDWTGDLFGFRGVAIANNSQIGDNTQGCTFYPSINGHICQRQDFGVLAYESIAPDFNRRIMWPVYLNYEGGTWNTTTNGWRQWQWQGLQPLNKRLARFMSIVQLYQVYNMTFQSEPPIDMRLQFQRRTLNGDNSEYIVIKLFYPRPNSIRVQLRGETIKPLTLRDNGEEGNLDVTQCGANKFFYHNYTVHFVVTGQMGCQVRVSLTNSVQLTMRFAMDIDDFFANDGKTLFIDRMAALLNIEDTSRIKIVGVYTGSVNIVAFIDEETTTDVENATSNDNDAQAAEMEELQRIIDQMYENGSLSVGLVTGGGLGQLQDMESSLYTHRSESEQQDETWSQKNKTALIIGLVIGLAGIIAVATGIVMYLKRKRTKISQEDTFTTEKSENKKINNSGARHDTLTDFYPPQTFENQ